MQQSRNSSKAETQIRRAEVRVAKHSGTRGLLQFREYLLGMVEGLAVAAERSVAPGTLLRDLGVASQAKAVGPSRLKSATVCRPHRPASFRPILLASGAAGVYRGPLK